jgi:hypothetical protein
MNVDYNMRMTQNDDDMLERDVIANDYSEFFGNAYAKKKNYPEVDAADAEKATKGLVTDDVEPEVEEPSSNIFEDLDHLEEYPRE